MQLFPDLDEHTPKALNSARRNGKIITGDARVELAKLDIGSVQCCITSPPYWGLRDYGIKGQIGAEMNVDEYGR